MPSIAGTQKFILFSREGRVSTHSDDFGAKDGGETDMLGATIPEEISCETTPNSVIILGIYKKSRGGSSNMGRMSNAFWLPNVGGDVAGRGRSGVGLIAITLFSLVIFLLVPYSVDAQCSQWNTAGQWSIQQQKTIVNFQLTQKGSVISGKADYIVPGRITKALGVKMSGEDQTVHYGDLDGTVKGDSFEMHVYWDNHTVGVYTGKISAGGRIEGEVYGKENPSAKVQWYSKINMDCPAAPATTPPPPPPVKTIKSTGHAKTSDGADVSAPEITATPNNAEVVPGKIPRTIIRWDGGPGHANAELWVKVDDLDEKLVIAQGKGNRLMVVDPHKTYIYILKDAGKQLASVRVKFH